MADHAHHTTPIEEPIMTRTFHLDRSNRKLFGVCSGLAAYTNTDPLLWRVGFLVGALTLSVPALVYFAIALLAD